MAYGEITGPPAQVTFFIGPDQRLYVREQQTARTYLVGEHQAGLTEAPADGQLYSRRGSDSSWQPPAALGPWQDVSFGSGYSGTLVARSLIVGLGQFKGYLTGPDWQSPVLGAILPPGLRPPAMCYIVVPSSDGSAPNSLSAVAISTSGQCIMYMAGTGAATQPSAKSAAAPSLAWFDGVIFPLN